MSDFDSSDAAHWVEKDLLNLVVDIFSQQHETNHLEWRKLLEVFPLNVDIEQVSSLLFLLCVGTDLLDCSVDQVLGMAVNCSMLSAGHHLVVLGNASVAFLLLFDELLPQQFQQV